MKDGSRVRAVLFDAAGTLFRVRGSVGEVYATIAARHAVVVDAHDVEARFRAAFTRMPPLAFPGIAAEQLDEHERAWWRTVVTAAFAGCRFADFEAFFADLYEHFARAESWELFADVTPALAALRRRGFRLGIVSNFDGRLLAICGELGLEHAVDTVVMSGRAGCAKPDPRIFGIALQQLSVAPADAVHVGDSESEDVAGARAAGLRAFLIRRGSPATTPPDELADLCDLINRL